MITIIETKTNDDAQAVGGAAAMSIDDDVQKEAHCPACAASESTTRLKDRGVVTTLMKAVAMMRAELVAHGMSEDAAGKLKGPALKDQVRALMNDGAMYLTAAVNGSGPMDQDDANGPAAELEGEESTPTATSDTESEARQKRNCLLDSPGKGITPINVDKRQTRLMRGRRLTLSLEGKQKEEEGAPFGCFESLTSTSSRPRRCGTRRCSSSPHRLRRARATTRTSAPCGRTGAPARRYSAGLCSGA